MLEGKRVVDMRLARILLAICLMITFSASSVMAAKANTKIKTKVNINSASSQELQTLPNIGPKTAQAIIKYRKKHAFKSVDELLEVKGIGEKTLKKLRPYVTVGKTSTKAKTKSKTKSKKKKSSKKSTKTSKKTSKSKKSSK